MKDEKKKQPPALPSTPRRGTADRPNISLVDCLLPKGHPHGGAK